MLDGERTDVITCLVGRSGSNLLDSGGELIRLGTSGGSLVVYSDLHETSRPLQLTSFS